MNDCNVDALSRYLDCEVAPSERRTLDAHLRDCQKCANEIDVLRRLDGLIGTWGGSSLPPSVHAEMRILDSVDRRRRLGPLGTVARLMPAALGSSIAAALVLLSANAGWLYQNASPPGTPTVAREVRTASADPSLLYVNTVRIAFLVAERGVVRSDLQAKYLEMSTLR